MKKIATVLVVIMALLTGFTAGYYTSVHSIVDVQKSADGFQVTYSDGTGYWYEY